MIIVDAHQDIAYNALSFERDYLLSTFEKRRREAGSPVEVVQGRATLGLPDALIGRVGIVFATLFTEPARKNAILGGAISEQAYRTPQEAYRRGMDQLDYYQRLFDRSTFIRPVRSLAELDAVLATWDDGRDLPAHVQGMVMLMENADPILEPKQFEEWYARGVRVVGPAWASTRYCGGTGEPGPLTALGRELLDVMAGLNALLDLSHMAEQSFFEALDRYAGALIASHSNPRRFIEGRTDPERLLTDTQIRRLAERDGVMGIVPFNWFLHGQWTRGDARLPLSRLLEAIDYVCQLTGSAAHVGIGTDFDGGFGEASLPEGIDTVSDLWGLGPALAARGYAQANVEAILSGNFLRKLRQTLPASA